MKLTRSLGGFPHPYGRDYNQERTELTESYQDYLKRSNEEITRISEDPNLTSEERRRGLEYIKGDLLKQEEEYNYQMQQINSSEAEHMANEYGFSPEQYAPDAYQSESGVYSTFAGETEQTRGTEYDAQAQGSYNEYSAFRDEIDQMDSSEQGVDVNNEVSEDQTIDY